ncbi:MAG: glycosyltransferase [Actinomycetota bacterium]|nr:glycosyltransferase [Actinomycetota bacterium]
MIPVAIVHDYLTQRGGAERVVLAMTKAFPSAPLYASVYLAEGTFPEFQARELRLTLLNRVPLLRRRHRLDLPLLAPTFSRLTVRAEVTICSSSGWAHGANVRGRKIVYCYTPARWLYQTDRYLGRGSLIRRGALAAVRPYLERWDRAAASSAHRYLATSTAVRDRIRRLYGIEAQVLHPPHTASIYAERSPVDGLEPGFVLCVARLLPYKNVDAIVEAFAALPDRRLVVAGNGPLSGPLQARSGPNVRMVGTVTEAQLRWLYASSAGLVAASFEDFGLTPLEAAAFGKPAAVLRWGGFLDTLVEHETGVFITSPDPPAIRSAVQSLVGQEWDPGRLRAHAEQFSEARFITGIREVVDEERALV